MPDKNYITLSVDEALTQLKSSHKGLSNKEVALRQQKFGANALPEEKTAPWFIILVLQLKSPLVYVLVAAATVSFILDEPVDGGVILAAVLIQVVVGFIQEFRAQRSLAALKKVISLSARVVREGKESTIGAEELVPGDVIIVHAGDKISADARLLDAQDCEINESSLTGESEPVAKQNHVLRDGNVGIGDRTNMMFTGTVMTKGKAVGVVTAIGHETEIGKIATLIKETKDEATPLQQKLASFSKKISIAVVIIAILIFVFGYVTNQDLAEMFTVSVAVAVSAIPEGLAVAVTIILAVGMQRILKRKALVRKLVAAETLGSTDVICTDKTGTLTQGNMQVTDFISWETDFDVEDHHGSSEKTVREMAHAFRLGMLCNDAVIDNPDDDINDWRISGNLTERALLLAGSQIGLHRERLNKEAPRIDTEPFTSTIKYMATLHREAHGHMLYVKGAPEIVLAMCDQVLIDGKSVPYDDEKRKKFERKFTNLSKHGLRIIALVQKHTTNAKTIEQAGLTNMTFVGYIGIKDPLRAEAKATVAKCKQAGITTVMITGDHKLTAQAIAKELGLEFKPENVMEGFELDALSEHELNRRVQDIKVYARVTPQHKLRIVSAWQYNGKVVAMTGDGINDSPAIKAADIGVALGSGTDVAKETADMVILDDNFSTIVAAVEEGRGIFDNIKKTVLYLLSDSFAEVVLIIGAIIVGLPIPLTATQILWLNIVKDSFPSLAMTQEPKEPEIMNERPRGRKAEILDKEVRWLVVTISTVTGIVNLGRFYFVYMLTNDLEVARTVAFLGLALDSLFYMFSIRSMRQMLWTKGLFSNPWLIGSFFVGIVLQVIAIYTPFLQPLIHTTSLSWHYWVFSIPLSFVVIVIIESIKYLFLATHRKRVASEIIGKLTS